MTKREILNLIATTNADNEEIVNFCNHELELLDKKVASSSASRAKKNEGNEVLKTAILKTMCEFEEAVTTSEIHEQCEAVKTLSPQKVISLVTALKTEGKVSAEKRGKKTYYSIVE